MLGQDIFGKPFSQNTFTVEISANGARLQGLPPVAHDSTVLLECGQERARYRVAWVAEKGDKFEGHVGLECVDRDKCIFGVTPPETGSFYDEYKRVEAELHRSEDRYRSLFENSLGLICTHDMQGALITVNPAASRALGYKPSALEGRNLAEFLAPSARAQFPDYLDRVREYGQDAGYMLVVGREREKHVWLYRNLLVWETSSPPYVVGHAMDVTEQKKFEYRLQSALKDLQNALAEVRTLKGLLSICAWCKRIRTQTGDWTDLESYITAHSEANFSHGVCPDCVTRV